MRWVGDKKRARVAAHVLEAGQSAENTTTVQPHTHTRLGLMRHQRHPTDCEIYHTAGEQAGALNLCAGIFHRQGAGGRRWTAQ
jgi:hypothetical protein